MPSNSQYWHETFGIVSIEAQHAGCRVVASDDGVLRVLAQPPATIVRQLEELIAAPSAPETRIPQPGGALAGTAP